MNYSDEFILSKLGSSLRYLQEELIVTGGLKKLVQTTYEITENNNDTHQLLVDIKQEIISLKKGQQEILKSNFEIKKAILIQGGANLQTYDKNSIDNAFNFLYSDSTCQTKKYLSN